jgi:hypothetical protein
LVVRALACFGVRLLENRSAMVETRTISRPVERYERPSAIEKPGEAGEPAQRLDPSGTEG